MKIIHLVKIIINQFNNVDLEWFYYYKDYKKL